MVTRINRHPGYRPHFTPVALPPSFLQVADRIGLEAGNPMGFAFRVRRAGTEVWLIFDKGLRVNLSSQLGIWPKGFAAARQWACAFARDHGFPAREEKRKRTSPREIGMKLMRHWASTYGLPYTPDRTAFRDACDKVVGDGLAIMVEATNSYVWHRGQMQPKRSYALKEDLPLKGRGFGAVVALPSPPPTAPSP